MDVALWVIQVLLALVFVMAGVMKLTQPKEKIAAQMPWANDFSQNNIRLIGLVEVLGAIGLILPSLTRILPVLTPLAALGLVVTMVGAILTHLRRKETPMIVVNVVLLVLAAVVVYGRFVAVPL
ncbi:MAG: DoxX family protein [Anaerolineae bacterium]|nr:DoxX family protein [Anaerolineae bacterium]